MREKKLFPTFLKPFDRCWNYGLVLCTCKVRVVRSTIKTCCLLCDTDFSTQLPIWLQWDTVSKPCTCFSKGVFDVHYTEKLICVCTHASLSSSLLSLYPLFPRLSLHLLLNKYMWLKRSICRFCLTLRILFLPPHEICFKLIYSYIISKINISLSFFFSCL